MFRSRITKVFFKSVTTNYMISLVSVLIKNNAMTYLRKYNPLTDGFWQQQRNVVYFDDIHQKKNSIRKYETRDQPTDSSFGRTVPTQYSRIQWDQKHPQERGGDEFDFDDEKAEISTGDEFILDNQLVFLNVR